jgi:hypothetical protein
MTIVAIHYCTVRNSTGRYAESVKFFKQEKTTAAKAAFFSGERQSFYGECQLRIDTNKHVLAA